jgi:hypothetical protein
MQAVPITLSDFIAMALPGAILVLPLLATVMPVSEIGERDSQAFELTRFETGGSKSESSQQGLETT